MLTRVVAVALVAAGLTLPAVPAVAAGDSCVSKKEFEAVAKGWTPAQVAAKFDTNGKRVTAAEFSEVRRYPKCSGGTSAIVNYERKAAGKPLRLTSKYW